MSFTIESRVVILVKFQTFNISPRNTRYIHKNGFDVCSNTFMSTYNHTLSTIGRDFRRTIDSRSQFNETSRSWLESKVAARSCSFCVALQARQNDKNDTMERMQHLKDILIGRREKEAATFHRESSSYYVKRQPTKYREKKKNILKTERANEQSEGDRTCSYLQTLQVRLRHGTLAVSGFTVLLEIASRLAACDTLREGPSAPPADEKFPPSQIPDFWDT